MKELIGKRDVSSRHRSLRSRLRRDMRRWMFLPILSQERARVYDVIRLDCSDQNKHYKKSQSQKLSKKKGNKINKSRNGRKRKPKTPSCLCMSVSGNLSLVSRGVRGFLLFWLFIVFYLISVCPVASLSSIIYLRCLDWGSSNEVEVFLSFRDDQFLSFSFRHSAFFPFVFPRSITS